MTAADRKLLESFRKALAAHKLSLVYQPKVSLKDGKLEPGATFEVHGFDDEGTPIITRRRFSIT